MREDNEGKWEEEEGGSEEETNTQCKKKRGNTEAQRIPNIKRTKSSVDISAKENKRNW